MRKQRTTLSAPKAALVQILMDAIQPAFAADDLTASDIREALDIAWQRVWDDAFSRRFDGSGNEHDAVSA